MSIFPTIEEQIAELREYGWVPVRARRWQAPNGGLYLGPHGAWRAMRAIKAQAEEWEDLEQFGHPSDSWGQRLVK